MKNGYWLWLGLLALIFLGGYGVSNTALARGLRNNNPLNIRSDGKTVWEGQTGVDDGGFIIFKSVEYGFRAGYRILQSYSRRGLNTVSKIITTWAPPTENPTDSYIGLVADAVGVGADEPIDITSPSVFVPMLQAMTKMENGVPISFFSDATVQKGAAIS